MADIKFACPSCAQHITCDELWSGQQIQCPSCQGTLTVPSKPQVRAVGKPAPAPAADSLVPKPPAATKLATQIPAQQPAQTGVKSLPIRNLAPPPPPKKNVLATIAKVAVVLILLGVGGYFGWGFLRDWQQKANAETQKMAESADGGEVGHTMELYEVLDATEPGGGGLGSLSQGSGPRQRSSGVGEEIPMPGDDGSGGMTAPKKTAPKLPILPVTYTLSVQRAKIPEGQVNGKIAGTDFVAEQCRLDRAATSYVLRFTQGNLASPDREIQIFLRLKSGETVSGQTFEVSPERTGVTAPQVVKVWKTNPRYAPQRKTFGTGYAMRLELGQISDGTLSGKIFLSLPDTEKTVIAGVFYADTSVVEGEAQPGVLANPMQTSGEAMPGSPERDAFQKRYGLPK